LRRFIHMCFEFKDIFLWAQELSVLVRKESGGGGRRSAWRSPENQDLLAKQTQKPKCHGSGGRDTRPGGMMGCGPGLQGGDQESQGTAGAELGWGRGKEERGSFRYTGQQRKMKETVPPSRVKREMSLQLALRRLTYSVACFASVFTSKCSSHTTQVTDSKGRDWGNEEPPAVGEHQVQDHLRNLKMHKSRGPNEVHPKVLK